MKSTVIVVSSLLLLLSAFVNECQGFGALFPPAARGKRKGQRTKGSGGLLPPANRGKGRGPQTKVSRRDGRNSCN